MRRLMAFVGALSISLAMSAGAAEPSAKIVRTWKTKCASCHGVEGKGDTDQGAKLGIPNMATAAWQKSVTDEQMNKSIANGLKRPGKADGMDPYADVFTPEQISELVTVVRGLAK